MLETLEGKKRPIQGMRSRPVNYTKLETREFSGTQILKDTENNRVKIKTKGE